MEIHRNRLNAIRAATRMLQEAARPSSRGAPPAVPLALRSIAGGDKTNAIPRECEVVVFVPAERVGDLRAAVERARAALAEQYGGSDGGLRVSLVPSPTPPPADAGAGAAGVFGPADTLRLLDLLHALPAGVIAMSHDLPHLVETSNNPGVARTSGDTVRIDNASRSSVAPALRDVGRSLHSIARLAGAAAETEEAYPGWTADLSSRALATTRAAYRRLFGRDLSVTAVHAGLECGLIGQRIPGLDMISFGPQIEGAHAPGERVHAPSVGRFWQLLAAVLEDLRFDDQDRGA